jgi:hypothetical protein
MPDILLIIIAGVFLPLFPMSMIFNALLDRICHAWIRTILLFVWPLIGIIILDKSAITLPGWVFYLALVTSVLYALRVLSLREVGQWSGFLATSFWSLLWVSVMHRIPVDTQYIFAISMSLPLILLIHLSARLEKHFGAAYTGLYGGLATSNPRFAGVLVAVVVAATATPLFPTFFIMLDMVITTLAMSPLSTTVILLVWLLWSWAAARLIQGLIVGSPAEVQVVDLDRKTTSVFELILTALVIYGVYLSGVVL